jgi:hypothetical protein
MSAHVQLTGERDKILNCDKVENQTWAFSVEKPCRVGVRVESLFTGVDQIPESFRFRWNAFGRRILTEARDRLMPVLPYRFRRQ